MTVSSPTSTGQPKARPLNKNDYKTLGLSSLGGTLEFYDFVIFVFFTGTLTHLFFPGDNEFIAQMKTLGIFAAGYLARPLGGIIMAHYGDKIGRKRMFTLSIFLMALPTLVIGLLPTYETIGVMAPVLLLLMRILQGAAIGGEMPGAWVFIAEHTPEQRYGLGVGTLTSGITGGILLGSIIAIVVQRSYSTAEINDFAWRIPFVLGGVFGFISVYLRKFLQETPIFKEMAAKHTLAKELPVKTVIRSHKLACVITAILTWSLSTAIVVTILMTPSVVVEKMYQVDRTISLEANCVATLMLTLGCIFWGWISDKLGTRACMTASWGGLAITAYYFYSALHPEISGGELMFNYGLMGFFVGAIATTPIVATRAFPPAIRFSGLSFAYNLAYAVFGGLTPMITGAWLQQSSMAPAYYVAGVSLLAIVVSFLPLAYKGWTEKKKEEIPETASVSAE
ncbi:MFS transporter [Pragia fontium]|uniref:Predicted arabinose efflux permease, MFS family n=1 Tax=Pragia fontium DSM 5563 = ATCC 49100 TaxID=1122977 RepID=A0AAJ4W823_9GAMM|nr:MFS transporter [Pragia fontium]AKJ41235.1 MFS transporter permease [Pragia fontium]SFC08928.1 Predicted arabinose efflux permease, MFS family [Pragia fontium DSM 5563 = ATCC 49100]SUB81451.1 Proline porter II [Pragia fontium]VEJ53739.1 Proline porter II [Pragia fontium]